METIKISKNLTLSTDGKGFWSNRVADVKITDILIEDDEPFNWVYINVKFDTDSWNVDQDGLIYTDKTFIRELKKSLKEAGYLHTDKIIYTEQGMQGDDFVSLEAPAKFVRDNF